ncbi:KH domain-containing protein [Cucumis melo var. makuwa]|uniref:KH domain-containing protein n=1 Tax=Cucumis melo var. makuwa TaxID=1194695 RepID=A0A5A7U784_CUCMM|nr:KH domain-containing protein [Cucumis melo var. makuwa]
MKKLAKKIRQNRPITHWIRLRNDNTIRYDAKRGAIIIELRRFTKANTRIPSKKNLPKVALEDDEMVQLDIWELDVAKEALVHIVTKLRANLFYREDALLVILFVLLYLLLSADGSNSLSYDGREGKRHGRGHSYSSGYGGFNDLVGDVYGSYKGL